MEQNVLLFLNYTVLQVFSLVNLSTPMAPNCIQHVVIPFKGSWIEFATDINSVMYAYIDRKKKLPVTTLFRAIGYERDKDILEIFDLAEEVKVSKTGLKKYLGRKLAARVLRLGTKILLMKILERLFLLKETKSFLIVIRFLKKNTLKKL